MKISNNKLFTGILLLGVTTGLLVLFDVQYFYLRAIFSFIFLTTIPGLLIMLLLKIRNIGFWEYLVYTVCLSIAFLMFAGLAVNWILPWLHITDKPLSLTPLLISFDTILSIFGILAYKLNKLLSLEIRLPKLNWLNKAFLITPLLFPLLSILGATTLNNGGPNYLTMIMLGGIAAYLFLVTIYRNKLNDNIYILAILQISISLLLMFALRSWHLSGWDIHQEFYVFQLTNNLHRWSINSFRDAYNACLSITILPTLLSNITGVANEYVYKLIYPLFFAFIPAIVFILTQKISKNHFISFLSCLLFIIQPTYFIGFTMVLRQGIAFLFFGLILLTIFGKQFGKANTKFLVYIFSFAMIVSHYSTAFVAIAIFTIVYLLIKLSLIFNQYLKTCLHQSFRQLLIQVATDKIIDFPMIVGMSLFAFYWFGVATGTGNNIIAFTNSILTNHRNIIKNELNINQSSLLTQINLFYKVDTNKYFKEYISTTNLKIDNHADISFYSNIQTYVGKLHIVTPKYISPKISNDIILAIYLFIEIVKKITKLFTIIGVCYFTIRLSMKNSVNSVMMLFIFTNLLLLTFGVIIPLISVDYDLLRLFQQTLIILSFPTIIGGLFIISKLLKSHSYLIMMIVIIIYYLSSSGLIQQLIGGNIATMQLNNYGENFDRLYTFDEDIYSAKWLQSHYVYNTKIYADKFASWTLMSHANFTNTIDDVLPSTISKISYVYLRSSNTVKGLNFKRYEGKWIDFSYPNDFLTQNKNLIYSNIKSNIYY